MKLFIILYSYAQLSGVVGPLETTMPDCEQMVVEFNQNRDRVLSTGISAEGYKLTEKEIKDITNLTMVCEYRAERPEIKD